MQPLTSSADYDALRELPLALLYKHSTRCPISAMAYREVQMLHDEHPDVPVHVVDVIADRRLARQLAEETGVEHHSPQLILLVRGSVAWAVSHFDVRADELSDRLQVLVD